MKRQKKKKKRSKPKLAPTKCVNCGKIGPHFVGPSFGDKGFFICEPKLNRRLNQGREEVKKCRVKKK